MIFPLTNRSTLCANISQTLIPTCWGLLSKPKLLIFWYFLIEDYFSQGSEALRFPSMGEYHLFFLNNCIYPDIVQNYAFIKKKNALRVYVSTAGRHWWHCSEKDMVLNTSERTVPPSSRYSVRKPGIILHSFPPIFLETVKSPNSACHTYFSVFILSGALLLPLFKTSSPPTRTSAVSSKPGIRPPISLLFKAFHKQLPVFLLSHKRDHDISMTKITDVSR